MVKSKAENTITVSIGYTYQLDDMWLSNNRES